MIALILALLQAFFIACKCAGVTNIAGWSWFLVFTPVWIVVTFVLLVIIASVIAHWFIKALK